MLFPHPSSGATAPDPNGRPDLLCTGAGTEASPFKHAAGTAGFNQVINALPRSGRVRVVPSRFDTTIPILLSKHGLNIIGDGAGFNEDPNGESEGSAGTKLKAFSTALFDVQNYGSRRGGVVVESLYCWSNDGYAATFACFRILSGLDQFRPSKLNISNFGYGFRVAGNEGGLDTAIIDVNILNAGCGYYNDGASGSYYNTIRGCWSDLEWSAWASNNRLLQGFVFDSMIMTRTNRVDDTSPANKKAAVYLQGRNHKLNNLHISETGRNYITNSQIAGCDGLVLDCDFCEVNGGQYISNVTGAAIRIKGNSNTLNYPVFKGHRLGGDFSALPYDPQAGYSTNLYDIVVEATAQDTMIWADGRVVDKGVRTVLNGVGKNAGDPNTAGDWNGRLKWEGLRLYDTVNDVLYEYRSVYPNGRLIIVTD